ncbi:MAG: Uma2 family endonuclease [Pirellulales bacterium]
MVALTIALREKPCQPLGSDQRVRTADDFITYPDISIHCDQPRFDDQHPESLLNPRVLIEILSESTEGYDRGKKFELYQVIPGFREYLLIAQDRVRIERFVRQDDGDWKLSAFVDPTAVVDLASVGCALRVADIYAGVEFPQT